MSRIYQKRKKKKTIHEVIKTLQLRQKTIRKMAGKKHCQSSRLWCLLLLPALQLESAAASSSSLSPTQVFSCSRCFFDYFWSIFSCMSVWGRRRGLPFNRRQFVSLPLPLALALSCRIACLTYADFLEVNYDISSQSFYQTARFVNCLAGFWCWCWFRIRFCK